MKTHRQITLALLLIALALADNDHDSNGGVESLYLELTQCTFLYSQSQNSINFHNCSRHSYQSSDWNGCFQKCCSSQYSYSYPTPSSSALLFCQKTNEIDDNESSVLKIVILSLLGLTLTLLCICCICKCKRQNQLAQERASRHNIVMNLHLMHADSRQVQWAEEKNINRANSQGILWSNVAHKDKPLLSLEGPCTICLDSNTTCQLFCKHQFHPKCIGDWLKKHNVCPCCRRQHIKSAKIYCSQCRWNYYVVNYALLTTRSRYMPLMCQSCQDKNEVKGQYSLSQMLSNEGGSKKQIKDKMEEEA